MHGRRNTLVLLLSALLLLVAEAYAIDESIPTPVLSGALYARFDARGEAHFADRVLSALRYEFGGHEEQTASPRGT